MVVAMADLPLTRVERMALKLAEGANERPAGKWLQSRFLRGVSYSCSTNSPKALDGTLMPLNSSPPAARQASTPPSRISTDV